MAVMTATGCCPRFDPTAWDGQDVTWNDKLFVRDRVHCLLHVPLDFGAVMKRARGRIEAAGALEPEGPVLAEPVSPWRTDVYVAVSRKVPGADHERLSGTFFTKVFEGPYGRARQWCEDTRALLAERGRTAERMFTWYTTCPRCAKAYGSNPVVMVARI